MGEREIGAVSGRLPDNPGELARMKLYRQYVFDQRVPLIIHFPQLLGIIISRSETTHLPPEIILNV